RQGDRIGGEAPGQHQGGLPEVLHPSGDSRRLHGRRDDRDAARAGARSVEGGRLAQRRRARGGRHAGAPVEEDRIAPHIIGAMARAPRSVGRNVLRKEGVEKVTGAARYLDDLAFPGLLHGRTIRSTIPSGAIVRVEPRLDRAGFVVVDHRDIPGRNVVALIDDDQPALAEREVRHYAEPIVLLAHEDRDALLAADVRIEYRPSPPHYDPETS